MDLMPVRSTNIHAIGYDAPSQTLAVQFKSGDVYQYSNVDAQTYQKLMSGDIGRYFAEIIKPQRYTMPFVKLGQMPLARSSPGLFPLSPSDGLNQGSYLPVDPGVEP